MSDFPFRKRNGSIDKYGNFSRAILGEERLLIVNIPKYFIKNCISEDLHGATV